MQRFLIQRKLGAGGMGVVYEALDRERDVQVALKTLRDFDAVKFYRLKKEFRALADITHPNLVTLYELVSEGDECFFTMELIDGVSFLEWVRRVEVGAEAPLGDTISDTGVMVRARRKGAHTEVLGSGELEDSLPATATATPPPSTGKAYAEYRNRLLTTVLDVDRLRKALGQLAAGVFALHRAGKLHRDVKPSNVLVTREGRVVLCDFGLATSVGGAPHERTMEENRVVGTAAYMSPEQAAGRPLSEASDWYSVGVMLYEALTARLPFGGTFWEMLREKQLGEALAPSQLEDGIPADLEELCVELVRVDPDARPPGATILRRLGVEAPASLLPSSRSRHETPFVGRELQLQALRDAYQDVQRDARAVTLFVHGSSGMGKSALVRKFLDELVTEEALVLAGRCYDRESVPYKALDSLVDALSGYLKRIEPEEAEALMPEEVRALARLFPVLRRVEAVTEAPRQRLEGMDPHELRRRAFSALRELLTRLGERQRLVLHIDDLQWGDVDSAALLSELLRPPDPPALLLVACYRSEDVRTSAALKALRGPDRAGGLEGDVREVAVEALSRAEARELAEALAEALADPEEPRAVGDADRIAAESGGSPLFVEELVRHRQLGMARRTQAADRISLDEVVLERVAQLPEPARVLLTTVAVAGGPVARGVVAHASELEGEEPQALAQVRAERLVRTTGVRETDLIETFHDRIRESVVASLPAEELQRYHRRLALALQSVGPADPEALVEHWQGAGEPGRAGEYAALAAKAAAETLAFDRAAELYGLALARPSLDDVEAQGLRIRLADALANAGRGFEAAQEYLAAAETADPATRRHCQTQAANQLLITGHIGLGLETLKVLLADVGTRLPATTHRAIAPLLWHRARLRLRGLKWKERHETDIAPSDLARLDVFLVGGKGLALVDFVRGHHLLTRGLHLALHLGEKTRIAQALAVEAMYIASQDGASKRSRKLVEESHRIVGGSDDHSMHAWAASSEAVVDFFGGKLRAAADSLLEAVTEFRDHVPGATWELNNLRLLRLFALRHSGQLRQWQLAFDEYVRDAAGRGDLYAETSFRRASNLLWLFRDRPDEAREDLERTYWVPPEGEFHMQHVYEQAARVEISFYKGTTVALLESEMPDRFRKLDVARSLLMRVQMTRTHAWWSWAKGCLLVARRDHMRKHFLGEAVRCARRLGREKIGYATVWALLLRAGIAATKQDPEGAVALLRDSISTADACDMSHMVAAARRRLGELVGGDEGDALVVEADEWMRGEGIMKPERMADVYAPGFGGTE